MNTKTLLLTGATAVSLGLSAFATTYNGNGNTGFGGTIGNGSLTLTDNGTTLSGTVVNGNGNFNNVFVLYIDSVSGGFSDTSGFADANDGLRRAISGFDGGANRSTMTFASGFLPDYAIALGPNPSENFGGLWSLANGGNNSLGFVSTVNLTPTGVTSSSTYTFSLNLSSLGLTPGTGQSFGLFGTYISDTGFRSTEALAAANDSGTQGWNPFTQAAAATFTTTTVPEPTTMALAGMSGLATLFMIRRRR